MQTYRYYLLDNGGARSGALGKTGSMSENLGEKLLERKSGRDDEKKPEMNKKNLKSRKDNNFKFNVSINNLI